MNNPFEKAGELYAKHVAVPLLNSEKFHDFAENVGKVNSKVYEKTGIDVMGVENRDEDDDSKKSKLKKIGKAALKNYLLGVGTDIYNLNK